MIENIKILTDSLHVKFKNKLDDNFPNIFKGKRKMSGCYINMEDFESICKVNNLY